MADDEQALLGDSAADSPATVPQVGTLDVDLVIGKLLGYKNNPGKQVWGMMSADCVDWALFPARKKFAVLSRSLQIQASRYLDLF